MSIQIEPISQKLSEIKALAQSLSAMFDAEAASDLQEKVDTLTEQVSSQSSAAVDSLEIMGEELEEQLEGLANDIESLTAQFSDLGSESINSTREGVQEALGSFHERVISETTVQMFEIKSEIRERMENTVGEFQATFKETIRDCLSDAENSFKDLGEGTLEGINAKLQQRIEGIGAELVPELVSSVAKSMVTAQISQALTTALQPHIGSLMAAKALAPAIQKALDVMRAGV